MQKKRVLILSTSAGAGHVKAGEALAKAFAADPRVEKTGHEDALKYTNKLFRDFYSTLYFKLVKNAPELVGYFYNASDEPWKNATVRQQFDRLNTRALIKFIRAFDPDIIVCTHFMPAGIIAHLIEKEDLRAQLSIVVTDFDCHAMWLSRIFHRYFVAIEETKAHLEALGLPGNRITVSGIPIDPGFTEPIDRAAVRKSYGLHPDRPTVLLSAGAIGGAPVELIVQRLEEGLRKEVQTLVVCGRNAELREKVLKQVAGNPRFCVLGFSDRMAELMKISDLFIGKPGGLTTSELLACGVPLAIIQPIPGQEERNSDHLLEEGIAIKCNELTTLAYKVDRLLGDPARLATMRRHALALGRPHAARTVVETLLADDLPALVLNDEQREAMTQIAAPDA
ncbi:MAG TPA: glycosyltransferase [Chthoniobacteraceae bacterium]|jgi:processive 1,2-diacylglycerol beta-glucosyltransferase|nr:glycosyltransferase [Chthoniobacteraceae bacterium]